MSGKERKLRKGPWIVGGLAIYSFTAYGSYLYSSLARAEGEYKSPEDCKDVSYRYNETAKNFDNEVGLTEKLMGIGWLRQSLTKRAFGDVLEVSAGTGRNVQYYDLGKCKSITMVDQSEEMLKIAKKKFRGMRQPLVNCSSVPHYSPACLPDLLADPSIRNSSEVRYV